MDWLLDPQAWIAFATLLTLEVVLGIDNVVFISILASKLPKKQQAKARYVGLGLAMLMRIINFLFDRRLEEPERGLKVLEVYRPALNQARIVRLYLPKNLREEFYSLAKSTSRSIRRRHSVIHVSSRWASTSSVFKGFSSRSCHLTSGYGHQRLVASSNQGMQPDGEKKRAADA
jgi:hypothetical protein